MTNPKLTIGCLFSNTAIQGAQGQSQTIVLLPDGVSELRDGTTILMDAEGAKDVVDTFATTGVDLPFDRDHALVLRGAKGEPAPAYGWGKRLHYEPGRGLLCDVEWTDEGYADIMAGRYRYLSPVIGYEKKTGRVRAVTSAAMTNQPATPNMPALAASFVLTKENRDMDGLMKKMLTDDGTVATAEQKIGELKALLESKGVELGDGADFVAIINAAIAHMANSGEKTDEPATDAAKADAAVAASVRTKLGLAAGADGEMVTKALADLQGHVGYVPAKEYKLLSAQVEGLMDNESQRKADDLVELYLSEGKLLPSDTDQMKWAKDRAKNAPDDFIQVMAHAPVIVPQGRTVAPRSTPTSATSTDEDALLKKSLASNDGNFGAAYAELQSKLMGEHTARGMSKSAALDACEREYPKIFG